MRRKTAGQHGDVAQLEEHLLAILWTHALCLPVETQDRGLRSRVSQVLLHAPYRSADAANTRKAR